jgi:hypothetical protein
VLLPGRIKLSRPVPPKFGRCTRRQETGIGHGPSSAAIPKVRPLLSIQSTHASCRVSETDLGP